MIGGIILVVLGLLILLASLGYIGIGFWDIILWLLAIGFGVSGLITMSRFFPRGLVSFSIGVILILKLLGIIEIGFWTFVGVIAGVWLIQLGLFAMGIGRAVWMMKGRGWRRWW